MLIDGIGFGERGFAFFAAVLKVSSFAHYRFAGTPPACSKIDMANLSLHRISSQLP
jgi:hypothetical protein